MSDDALRFFGKYRGMVTNNIDPLGIGRLQVQVPDVAGVVPGSWALPCFPFASTQLGFYALPQIGGGVWVEFEQGNPDYPIWSGCWYGSRADVPGLVSATPPGVPVVIMQTQGQTTLLLSDLAGPTGGVLIKTTSGAMISINDVALTISNGKGASIVMTGPTVAINGAALTIT
jgi:uncharacterized protein involved in type VI secretion and phage assembly